MPPRYLIIGLSQLTEPLIPSYVVKLEHYDFSCFHALEEAVLMALTEDSELTTDFFDKHVTYSFSEWLMDTLSEREEEGSLSGEYWEVHATVSEAILGLTWAYFEHFYHYLNNTLGHFKPALDSVTVHSFLEPTHDIILEFDWDLTRLSYTPVENYTRSQR